jgi:hypothetical protein
MSNYIIASRMFGNRTAVVWLLLTGTARLSVGKTPANIHNYDDEW